jgi:hypothetical protein
MKRSELKKIIKPLVKECILETLLEEGLLSNIVSEVAQGLGNQTVLQEAKAPQPRQVVEDNSARIEELRIRKKAILESMGKDAYNGIDLFEGTAPSAPEMTEMQAASPLGSVAPGDSGVDISGITALGGKKWKALIG